MADDNEFAAAGADAAPELLVKEGEDIDYRVVLAFYLLADLGVSSGPPPCAMHALRACKAHER